MSATKLDNANQLVERFKDLYANLNHATCDTGLIEQIYHQDMVFKDSFHTIHGVNNFKDYCSSLYQNLTACQFDFHKSWVTGDDAMLTWTMRFSHPRLRGGASLTVEGASEMRFGDKIVAHQDYFDGGNLLYEHVPVLGSIIGLLKKRMRA